MMKFELYKEKFIEKAANNGYSSENIDKCLNYAENLIHNNVPVIYNLSHLSAFVGCNSQYIRRAIKFDRFFYRKYEIKKKNGGTRVLNEPLPSLKEIQYWILNNILYNIKVSRYAKAYVPKKGGIKEHAKFHTNEKKVLTLDIKQFFDKIPFSTIQSVFQELGYSKSLANLFAKLCTLDKSLPQGAPTSPYLSNLVMRDFDKVLGEFSMANKYQYTRYADDLAFSGDLKKTALIKLVKSELRKIGLLTNNSKTKMMTQNVPQMICGIVVNKKAQVPKSKRNQIRNEMFFIEKFGLQNHIERSNIKHPNYLNHLLGKINYILSIYPKDKDFIKYKKYLHEMRSSR